MSGNRGFSRSETREGVRHPNSQSSKRTPATSRNQRHQRQQKQRYSDTLESDSEECPFDRYEDEDQENEEIEEEQPVQRSGWRWPKMSNTSAMNHSRTSSAGPTVAAARRAAPGSRSVRNSAAQAADVSLAARLEHLRASAHLHRQSHAAATSFAAVEDSFIDSAGPHLENTPLNTMDIQMPPGRVPITIEAARYGGAAASRSLSNTPRRQRHSLRKDSEASRRQSVSNGVVAAALADAAAGSISGLGSAPVAAVEECVLRLLVLQKELTGGEEQGRSVLADAAAGLAPRMLQVLEAARGVCEANRAKLRAYCEDRQLDVDRSNYLRPQISALDKLHGQYSSLQGQQPSGGPGTSYAAAAALEAHLNQLLGQSRYSPRSQSPALSHWRTPRANNVSGHWPMNAQHEHGLESMIPSASVGQLSSPRLHSALAAPLLDPGAAGPQLPALRSGGSTPPRAKFRQQPVSDCASAMNSGRGHHGGFGNVGGVIGPQGLMMSSPSPRSELSSAQDPASARGPGLGHQGSAPGRRTAASMVPAIPHWERRTAPAAGNAMWDAAGRPAACGVDASNAMWDATASAVMGGALHPHHDRSAVAAGLSGPIQNTGYMWDAMVSAVDGIAPVSARGLGRSPREAFTAQRTSAPAELSQPQQPPPLRSAMQQLRGVTDGLTNGQRPAAQPHYSVGGTHKAARSQSPEQQPTQASGRSARATPEDKYLKILQSLQAKGAVQGGLAEKLLEGKAISASRRKTSKPKYAVSSDSDSSSSDGNAAYRHRRARGRRVAAA
eukprot:TRINITY_DN35394_c0_g1_i1.p1 TRINITY_DN35394_c0_g1~~TRINITY_DN35394_c0_g1_i1.p1  ORF type:complete len:871 (+),score=161.92 TRINITY_DN35394_c0_g1_i1:269-2614(+)